MDCGDTPKIGCDGRHMILGQMEEVKAIMGLVTDVSGTFSEATERRQQIKELLQTATAATKDCINCVH